MSVSERCFDCKLWDDAPQVVDAGVVMSGARQRWHPLGWSRRAFLGRMGAAVAGLGLGGLIHARARASGDSDECFQHGVASGDPLADRVILWTRVSGIAAQSVSLSYVVARDPELADVVSGGAVLAESAHDYTVHVDVSGLQPFRTYYYRFCLDGQLSPIGRTRTLPVGPVDHLRLAVASCASYAHGYFNAYRRIAERADLDAVLHLGDYIYEVATGQYGSLRAYEPDHETVTLDDYRTRYAQYRRDADLQAMHRQHAVISIWDDHEFGDDSWQGGSRNHQPDTEGSWDDRVAAALQAYYEWTPARRVDADNPRKNYRRFRFGNLMDLFMLEDCVLARDEPISAADTFTGTPGEQIVFEEKGAFASPKRQILGPEQEAWLFNGLRQSSAQWRLIGQGTMMAQLKLQGETNAAGTSKYLNHYQWDGYAAARNRMFRCFSGDPARGLPAVDNAVVLSGDIHSGWAADLTPDPNNADVASGGYDPATGAGSLAVEFVCSSITSPAWVDVPSLAGAAQRMNPHLKYGEFRYRGYSLLDIRPERVSAEWWCVDTILEPSASEFLSASYQVEDGSRRVQPSTVSASRAGAARLAP